MHSAPNKNDSGTKGTLLQGKIHQAHCGGLGYKQFKVFPEPASKSFKPD